MNEQDPNNDLEPETDFLDEIISESIVLDPTFLELLEAAERHRSIAT
jgi:hypothetical protein